MSTTRRSRFWKVFYLWTRDLHLYLGLVVSPFVLVYALSAVCLNHTWFPWQGTASRTRSATITVPQEEDSVCFAKALMSQVGVTGEIEFVRRDQKENRAVIPVVKPGKRIEIHADLKSGVAEISERRTGVWDAMLYLHKMPGQHLVGFRGNWLYMRLWRWVADATVYLVLFSTATGIYLWAVLRAERKTGLVCLVTGTVFFAVALILVLI